MRVVEKAQRSDQRWYQVVGFHRLRVWLRGAQRGRVKLCFQGIRRAQQTVIAPGPNTTATSRVESTLTKTGSLSIEHFPPTQSTRRVTGRVRAEWRSPELPLESRLEKGEPDFGSRCRYSRQASLGIRSQKGSATRIGRRSPSQHSRQTTTSCILTSDMDTMDAITTVAGLGLVRPRLHGPRLLLRNTD